MYLRTDDSAFHSLVCDQDGPHQAFVPLRFKKAHWLLHPPKLLEQADVAAVSLVMEMMVARRRMMGRSAAEHWEMQFAVPLARAVMREQVDVVIRMSRVVMADTRFMKHRGQTRS